MFDRGILGARENEPRGIRVAGETRGVVPGDERQRFGAVLVVVPIEIQRVIDHGIRVFHGGVMIDEIAVGHDPVVAHQAFQARVGKPEPAVEHADEHALARRRARRFPDVTVRRRDIQNGKLR